MDMIEQLDSMFCLSHPANPALWREWVAPLGAMRKYLLEDRTDPIASYFDPAVSALITTEQKRTCIFSDIVTLGIETIGNRSPEGMVTEERTQGSSLLVQSRVEWYLAD